MTMHTRAQHKNPILNKTNVQPTNKHPIFMAHYFERNCIFEQYDERYRDNRWRITLTDQNHIPVMTSGVHYQQRFYLYQFMHLFLCNTKIT